MRCHNPSYHDLAKAVASILGDEAMHWAAGIPNRPNP